MRSLCLLLTPLLVAPWMAAQTFSEPGFVIETVASLGQYQPVFQAFSPDGRLFIVQRNGIIRIFKGGQLLPTPFLDIQARVNTNTERGMLGLAFDPAFAQNGYFYVFYTLETGTNTNSSAPKTNRLSRFRADPANADVALAASETVLLGAATSAPCVDGTDCIASDGSSSHIGGTIRVSPAGKLFLSLGDASGYNAPDPLALRAQNLDRLEGKILRINLDGTAPSDNPFFDGNPQSNRSRVYSLGYRNPFRFALDPVSGEPFAGDVGWGLYEEINTGRGKNFGWPCMEGPAAQPEYVPAFPSQCAALTGTAPPAYSYYHGGSGASLTLGDFHGGTVFPAKHRGALFFADFVLGWIRYATLDASRNIVATAEFATGLPGIASLETGPDGALYLTNFSTGLVQRIRYGGGPSAAIDATPKTGPSPLTVAFSSARSADPAGGALTYQWDFGDGTTSTVANPSHAYTSASPRTFSARLTVTNSAGTTATATETITVSAGSPPQAVISEPAAGRTIVPGETITYRGDATSPGGTLPEGAFAWQIMLNHDTHVHPSATSTGRSGSIVVADHGSGTFSYEFILTVTGPGGLTDTKSVRTGAITRNAPPAVSITSPSNGASFTAPASVAIAVTATDSDGSIAKVEYFNGSTKLGESTSAPYTFQWTGVTAGSYSVTARATDNGGAVASATASITVTAPANPVVTITSPASGASFTSPANIAIAANATIQGGSIAKVEFFQGAVKLSETAQTPYAFTWTGAPAGSHQLTVKATSAAGASGQSSVTVNVTQPATTVPVVWLASPQAGDTFSAPAAIWISADATDPGGIAMIEFYNGSTKIGEDNTSPYGYNWTNVAGGTYQISAKAIARSGTSASTPPVSVAVDADGSNGLYGEYFTGNFSGKPKLSRIDSLVDFTFGSSSPGGGLAARDYSIRWSGQIVAPLTGTIQFCGYYVDGMRVVIGGTTVINNLTGSGAGSTCASRSMTQDRRYSITVEYRNVNGNGAVDLRWLLPGGYWQAVPNRYLFAPSFVSDLSFTTVRNDWGPVERDMSVGERAAGDGRTISLRGKTYTKGLGVHARSEVVVPLNGKYTSFQSDIGVDDEVSGRGSVTFQVYADGQRLFDSGAMTGTTAARSLNVTVTGKNELRLIVIEGTDIGNDHADWAWARLFR